MKNIFITLLLVLIITISSVLSFAIDTSNAPEWVKIENEYLKSDIKSFLESYQITESQLNSEKTYLAFLKMRGIIHIDALDLRYKYGTIKSKELISLFDNLFKSMENPTSAKDYFYKGLFAYTPNPEYSPVFDDPYGPFEYIIKNYPDSTYAEFSYLILSGNYGTRLKKDNELELLKKYEETYGKNGKLIHYVYYNLSRIYQHLLDYKTTENNNKQIAIMLEYSNKFINEFSEHKDMAADVLLNLGRYYEAQNDGVKARDLYNSIINDESYGIKRLRAIKALIDTYLKNNEYEQAESVLEGLKTIFINDRYFLRDVYKYRKRNLVEIKRFGFSEVEFDGSSNKRIISDIPVDKKSEIEAFRTEYEKCFDKDINIIKPIENIKIGLPEEEKKDE